MNKVFQTDLDALRRQARILVLLDGAARAGLEPMGIIPFHAYAFLANVLAPVWDMPALDGRILKRKGGPFYPALQRDLDRMVGRGMVCISHINHIRGTDGRWRLEGKYSLNLNMSADALDYLGRLPGESRFAAFATELAYALSALSDRDLETALVEDATYSDPTVSENNVLDFGEWVRRNPSTSAADYFSHLMARGTPATPGEKIHLYVRHLRRRIHGHG